MTAYFITATDTDAGKTFVSTQILQYWNRMNYTTLGFKPVASGCVMTKKGLRNDDALKIAQASNIDIPYEDINPYAFAEPIAPHITAQKDGVIIDIETMTNMIKSYQKQAQYSLVEGVGGWMVPLTESETMADFAQLLNYPVILVVRLQLGCINQALLTVQAIKQSQLKLVGWIANYGMFDNDAIMSHQKENIAALKQRIEAPLLGVLPCLTVLSDLNGDQKPEFSDCIDMNILIKN